MKSLPLVRALLDAGADPNAPNPLPNSYVRYPAPDSGGGEKFNRLKLLTISRVPVAPDPCALHFAARMPESTPEITETLILAGAALETPDGTHTTPRSFVDMKRDP